ncbi:MFS transporter superfamily [Arabidopsis thaliana x Arabidopsis arenosa]|uniref:MFS transporter superfamily n=2 Tax=Arabidopsis TaxID=3701 RepID=A0A8T2G838_9BRAS|nr:Nucleoside transporter family protein [Arabidopsis thaliana]AAQ16125.1 equilibrative nucleoside transporter ENT8 splice variant [Arabidopsis thaliana]AEE27452.1 Nucleoside transporter family protein [Arabidopsis thaliana]KAG7644832.1 MFS transporter superfamily [Arabidopsis thaliana x Arabidopsis arenosa]|eukprot:NP_001030934.1 Nucleoside transporter family protein [Arabidopsis thaliana]
MVDEKVIVDEVETRDAYRVAYVIHFLLGAGSLIPWNALITAVDYFGYLYPDKHVEKTFTVAYMSCSVLVLVLMMTWNTRMSYRVRMNLGFSMFIIAMMISPLIDWVWKGEKGENVSYMLMVGSVVLCGLADGVVGGSLIGSAGKLPRQYMQAIFAGTASSGIIISLLRIATKASLPQTPQGMRTSAHSYFIVSSTILLCCFISCNVLHKLPVMQQHLKFHQPLHSTLTIWMVGRKIKWPASGKSLTALYLWQSIKSATWACIVRLLFYPLFSACLRGPKWLRTEVPVVVLTFMLGLTNGYLTSVLMIMAPKTVHASEAELAAIFMVVFLGLGLVCGSVIGWLWLI